MVKNLKQVYSGCSYGASVFRLFCSASRSGLRADTVAAASADFGRKEWISPIAQKQHRIVIDGIHAHNFLNLGLDEANRDYHPLFG